MKIKPSVATIENVRSEQNGSKPTTSPIPNGNTKKGKVELRWNKVYDDRYLEFAKPAPKNPPKLVLPKGLSEGKATSSKGGTKTYKSKFSVQIAENYYVV